MSKFILKEGANPNYLCTICKIGETFPIEGADRLVKTVINGYDIVVSKDMKPGTIVAYFPVECAISEKFLSANNLYERGEFEKNANAEEIKALIVEAENAETEEKQAEIAAKIKSMCGFFDKRGRVRILKLRGQYSQGFVSGVDSLVNFMPELADTNWESLVGTQFNFIDNQEICWKYIPPVKEVRSGGGSERAWKKRMKHIKRFDRLIAGQFAFHYDTQMLAEHIDMLKPDDNVVISVKVHGTSVILANILTNKESEFTKSYLNRKIRKVMNLKYSIASKAQKNALKKKYIEFKTRPTKEYGNIYASRSVIKNQYINPNKHDFYGGDPWGCVERDFGPYLDKGMTVYGEIAGYVEGSQSMIQAKHDYGCKPGHWKFMPYRITMTDELGVKTEWDIADVDKWTRDLVAAHPELEEKTMFLTILYHGRFGDLYPDLDETKHWHENVLARMKADRKNFLMEEDEPLCKNKVPREGIVIRIDGDKFARAWKLKTLRHYGKEAEAHDKGEADMEETA